MTRLKSLAGPHRGILSTGLIQLSLLPSGGTRHVSVTQVSVDQGYATPVGAALAGVAQVGICQDKSRPCVSRHHRIKLIGQRDADQYLRASWCAFLT